MLKCIPASLHLYVVLAGLVHNGHQTVPCSYHPFGLFHTFPHSADADELPNTLPYHTSTGVWGLTPSAPLRPCRPTQCWRWASWLHGTSRSANRGSSTPTPLRIPMCRWFLMTRSCLAKTFLPLAFCQRDMEKQKPRVKYQTIEEHERSVWSMRFGVVYLWCLSFPSSRCTPQFTPLSLAPIEIHTPPGQTSRLEKCKTLPARRMKEPTWMYQCEVDVLAPTSMVRIQVKDDRPTEKADIGFFDVCLGDIPYDKVGIRGKTMQNSWKKLKDMDGQDCFTAKGSRNIICRV